jgi:hypothetical protein
LTKKIGSNAQEVFSEQNQTTDKDELKGNDQPKCDWLRFSENAQRRALFACGYGSLASPDLIDDYGIHDATNNQQPSVHSISSGLQIVFAGRWPLAPRSDSRDNHDMQNKRPTVCVTGSRVGMDEAREQYKLEARKMLENGGESHLSSARFVRR